MTDPFARHREEVAAVLHSGDAAAVKRLYVTLGEDLAAAYASDPLSAPRLSYPETAAVVAAQVPTGARLVLDAGCGPDPGVGLLLAGRPGTTVVALDIGHGTVRLAVDGATQRRIRLLGVVADVERLPFRDGAFEAVVCDDTVEHLPDDLVGLAELRRVVRPGGTVVVATPNRWSAQVLVHKLRDLAKWDRRPASAYFAAESHLREYTAAELTRLARRAGLRPTGSASVPWPGKGKWRVASALTARGPGRLAGRVLVHVFTRDPGL